MCTVNDYNCSIENFIKDEYSICREERQYAVFLYNILRKYGKNHSDEMLVNENIRAIFHACGIEKYDKIEYVFYEATFMRDFFERERRYYAAKQYDDSCLEVKLLQKNYARDTQWEHMGKDEAKKCFNYALIKYVHKKDIIIDDNIMKILKYNLGHTQIKSDELEEREKEKIKAMMNGKPDIAIIYRRRGKKYLLFIECKFESYEDLYNGENMSQCSIQYNVAEFLCKYLNERNTSNHGSDYINISDIMISDKKSKIVKFVRTDENKKKSNAKEGEISIKALIDCNNEIFEEKQKNDNKSNP